MDSQFPPEGPTQRGQQPTTTTTTTTTTTNTVLFTLCKTNSEYCSGTEAY